jgi:hypothetical protein
LFNIELQKKGPEFSQIDDLRLEYIQKFAGKVPSVEIPIPKNIPGISRLMKDLYLRLVIYLQTVDYGDQLLRMKGTESLMSILIISIPELVFLSSSVSCCMDGGDTLLMPGTK